MLRRPRRSRLTAEKDDGSIMVLIIGYTAVAAILLIVGVDLSSVFLARRALGSAADSAAIAAAQGVDRQQLYDGRGPRCGHALPLTRGRAVDLAQEALTDARPGLRHAFRSVAAPDVSLAGATVGVQLTGQVRLPFGRVVQWLDPESHGTIQVSETSHAQSPVVGSC